MRMQPVDSNHQRRHRVAMLHTFTWLLTVFLMVVDTECKPRSISVSGQNFSIYRVKTHHHFEKYRQDKSNIARDISDLILELPQEIDSSIWHQGFEKDIKPFISNEGGICNENNGHCSQICENIAGKAICSCHEGFSVTSSGDCIKDSETDIVVLSGTSGNFTAYNRKILIKASENHFIKCVLKNPYGYSNAKVYDSRSNEVRGIYSSDTVRTYISKGPHLKIGDFSPYGRSNSYHVLGWYQTGTLFLKSNADFPEIRIPLSTSDVCYSFSFALPPQIPHNDWLLEQLKGKNVKSALVDTNSQQSTYIIRLPKRLESKSLDLTFPGVESNVYSLRKCHGPESHLIGEPVDSGFETKCFNGGLWDNTTETCLCPIGFIGQHCEEGCGPNRYGENCTEVCSLLSSQCEGLIFCTETSCSCAPGLQGRNCNETCLEGWYGTSCHQRCGKCKDGKSCDSYTGKCYSGCMTGFYPPLCQKTYKVLQDKPDIHRIGYTFVTLSYSTQNSIGSGEPVFYQVQYKYVQDTSWAKQAPKIISNYTEFNVSGLHPGKNYVVRIILIDKDGGSYQDDVPETTFMTKCIEPEEANYYFAAKRVNHNYLDVEWAYTPEKDYMICEMEKFELSFAAGDEVFVIPLTERSGSERIFDLLPETEYSYQLIGITVTGNRIVPSKKTIRTLPADPGKVREVQVESADFGTQLLISWQPPWSSADVQLRYRVTFMCEKLLACENVTCQSSGNLEVTTNSVFVKHLKPHALYEIRIAAISSAGLIGEDFAIKATTAYTAPEVAPSIDGNPILSVTNTSASLKWLPPADCTLLNGYLHGYSYILIDKETKQTLYQETVPENVHNANFSDLLPRHCYEAHIAITASGVTSFRNELVIPFCTTSTAPEKVQSLEVYKRGRRMVGLRWGLPVNLYGDIKSFTVTYTKEGKSTTKSLVIEPAHCEAWPQLFCHTVSSLSPGKKYRFVVQARNKEVDIDGVPASVEAITTEGVSTPPRNLRIVNVTENSVLLGWEIPDNINGQLRSFIIVTEQISMNDDSDECCDDIPLEDYKETTEKPFYTYEITGLSAASTYSVVVAAKTIGLGEEARIIVHTPPVKLNLPENVFTKMEDEECKSDCDTVSLHIHPPASIGGVNRTYLILLLSNSSSAAETLDDDNVATVLHSHFGDNYLVLSEYTEEDIGEESVVTFRPTGLGLPDEELQKAEKYALVVIQEYMDKKSVDVVIAKNT